MQDGANYAGAKGPMQFLWATWAAYGVDGDRDVYDSQGAIDGAASYLRAPRSSATAGSVSRRIASEETGMFGNPPRKAGGGSSHLY